MKKTLAVLLIFISTTFTYAQKTIVGTWEGKINIGGNSLRIVFHFEQKSNGFYSGSIDSPDQGAKGIHCDSIILKDDSVIVQVKVVNGGYNGMLVNDSEINGNWEQGGMQIPVKLKKSKVEKEKVAEQNKDTNCIETNITLETKTGNIYGTLCTPKNFAKGPVALIIAGSGPTDRDGNSAMGLSTDAYKILAHQLAAHNIATVRYDKRGVGESSAALKSESDIRFDDYINDATAWIRLLKSDKRFTNVVVIGHSEGSLIGMVAAKEDNADEYISIAGAGESIDKTLKRQLQTMPQQGRDTAYKIIDSLVAGKTVSHVDPMMYSLFRPSVQPYMISWMKYDPAVEIGKLTIPVLIIQGENDIQVTVEDAKKLSAGDKNATLVILKNMNHIFRDVEGDRQANVATYNNPSLPIDAKLVTAISDFINKN